MISSFKSCKEMIITPSQIPGGPDEVKTPPVLNTQRNESRHLQLSRRRLPPRRLRHLGFEAFCSSLSQPNPARPTLSAPMILGVLASRKCSSPSLPILLSWERNVVVIMLFFLCKEVKRRHSLVEDRLACNIPSHTPHKVWRFRILREHKPLIPHNLQHNPRDALPFFSGGDYFSSFTTHRRK